MILDLGYKSGPYGIHPLTWVRLERFSTCQVSAHLSILLCPYFSDPPCNFSQTWQRGRTLRDNSFSVNTLKNGDGLEGNTPTWGEVGRKSVITLLSFPLPFWPTRQKKHSTDLAWYGACLGHCHCQRRRQAAKDRTIVIEGGVSGKKGTNL